jgi:hypothetical protein
MRKLTMTTFLSLVQTYEPGGEVTYGTVEPPQGPSPE